MKQEELTAAFRNLMKSLFPELGSGTHLPHKARVLEVHGTGGSVAADGTGERHYSLDVEPLTPDGESDLTRPVLLDVPLEMFWAGPERGVLALPAVGSIVRVAYYGGSAAHPYIDGVVPDGWSVPGVAPGEMLVQHRNGTFIRITEAGDVQVHLSEDALGGSNINVVQNAPLTPVGRANYNHTQTDEVDGANIVHTQTSKDGGANRTLTLSDKTSGANLNLVLTAPSGGNLNVTITGQAQVIAKKDVQVTSQTGNVSVAAPAGKVILAGGGPPLARVGDQVQVDSLTHIGTIISGSTKAVSG